MYVCENRLAVCLYFVAKCDKIEAHRKAVFVQINVRKSAPRVVLKRAVLASILRGSSPLFVKLIRRFNEL